jgi:hypothetical protein
VPFRRLGWDLRFRIGSISTVSQRKAADEHLVRSLRWVSTTSTKDLSGPLRPHNLGLTPIGFSRGYLIWAELSFPNSMRACTSPGSDLWQ